MISPPYVYLCGAGPGAADLLTLRAHRLLTSGEADSVLYDDLIGEDVLNVVHPRATKLFTGKRCGKHSMTQGDINALLVEEARAGKIVVRLKGGDPLTFGRAGEEMAALRRAGVPFEVIPGVTAASAAAAAAGRSLTLRGVASSVRFLTGHGREGETPDFRAVADPKTTLAVYMGLTRAADLCRELTEGGTPADTPCVAVSRASLPDERVLRSRLDRFARDLTEHGMESPVLLLAGRALED